jgi:hypothetical protein
MTAIVLRACGVCPRLFRGQSPIYPKRASTKSLGSSYDSLDSIKIKFSRARSQRSMITTSVTLKRALSRRVWVKMHQNLWVN